MITNVLSRFFMKHSVHYAKVKKKLWFFTAGSLTCEYGWCAFSLLARGT